MTPQPKLRPVTFENCRILFRNFSGKKEKYNNEGNRKFSLLLDPETAELMKQDGWNVKYLKPREEDDVPQAHIVVKVSYKNRPPRVVMLTSRGKTRLDEDTVGMIDYADIENVDLIVNPSRWTNDDGETMISAYLQTLFVTIREDELEQKYSDVPENHLGGGSDDDEETPF